MPNDAVVFSRGLAATMPATYQEGRFLLQTDTGALFLDDTASSRIQIKDTTKLSLSGGTMTGPINMNNQKITHIANPTDNNDAANKVFVDIAFQTLESEVNQQLLGYLQLKGGTMTGILDMGNYSITSLATPSADTDAANKLYVDTKFGSTSTSNSNLLFATTSSNPDGIESPARLKLSIPGYTGGQAPANGTYLWVLSTNGFNGSIAPGFEINDSGSVISVDYTTNTGAMPLKAPNTMALFSSNGTSLKLIGTIFQIDEGTLS